MKNERRLTRTVRVGDVAVGGGAPVSVQSMTTADTKDLYALGNQIRDLEAAGCDIVRVALYDRECADLVPAIQQIASVPVVGDVHFDAEIAVLAIENGIDKIRVNPGNIGSDANVRRIADAARAHSVPIRVGANGGSLPKAQREASQAEALVDAALSQVRILEKAHFENVVISLKSSDAAVAVNAARRMADAAPYPLHLGVTEAGTYERAIVKSAVGIGTLLMEGIGDTIRVSISGDPVQEVRAGRQILQACGLETAPVEIISCPTCARCGLDVERAANRVEELTQALTRPVTIAVMGCAVNGPGEARRADIGIAGAPNGIMIFEKGRTVGTVSNLEQALEVLCRALKEQQGAEA